MSTQSTVTRETEDNKSEETGSEKGQAKLLGKNKLHMEVMNQSHFSKLTDIPTKAEADAVTGLL